MDLLQKNRIIELVDIYGELLTEKQERYIHLYVEEDLSIVEISEDEGVSRQAVSDNLRRTIDTLENFENKLGIIKKSQLNNDKINKIVEYINEKYSDNELIEKIKTLR